MKSFMTRKLVRRGEISLTQRYKRRDTNCKVFLSGTIGCTNAKTTVAVWPLEEPDMNGQKKYTQCVADFLSVQSSRAMLKKMAFMFSVVFFLLRRRR